MQKPISGGLRRSLIMIGLATAVFHICCKSVDPFSVVAISGPVVIGSNTIEFEFKKPFKPTKQAVKVCFAYSDDLNVPSISEFPKLTNGSRLELDGNLIDSDGRRYSLNHVANSVKNYICLSPELTDVWMNISKSDVSFTKLLMKSNAELNVTRVEWVSFNSWDL